MSDIIRQLPDSVANQIAAGEVVQRPSSIIKELVENSLDAGATRIQVIVTDAGKTCVQVIDNGKGMSETDARLAFERHATSKIREVKDLYALTTMGFRGEALPSIASVAQVELRTRQAEDELGVSINIEGSHVISQEPIMCPVGANFIVKNLFYNVPARRKFLKGNNTEYTHILNEFQRIALAHPEVSFSLSTPDSLLMDLPVGTFRQRIVSIFGNKIDKSLLAVQLETSVVQIAGFVGSPESCKAKAPQFFFVNGRYMRHPYFAKAVQVAFERLIPEGQQVPYFLQLLVDPAKIDVNIHPTKTEISFEDEKMIFSFIRDAVRETLAKFHAIPTIDFDRTDCPDIPLYFGESDNVKMPEVNINPNFNPFEQTSPETTFDAPKTSGAGRGSFGPASQPQRPPYNIVEELYGPVPSQETTKRPYSFVEENPAAPKLFDQQEAKDQQEWEISSSLFLQYKGRYLFSPVETGLLLIDIHRAHTRVLYDEYLERVDQHNIESQGLLFPQILELSPTESAIFETMLDEVQALGFEVSPLGGGNYQVLRVPGGIEGMDPDRLLLSMIDDAIHSNGAVKDEMLHIIAQTLARKTAIPVGQLLSQDEMKDLATKLFASSNPNFTPDGKVITTILPDALLTSKF